jgi:hypothetical protein
VQRAHTRSARGTARPVALPVVGSCPAMTTMVTSLDLLAVDFVYVAEDLWLERALH